MKKYWKHILIGFISGLLNGFFGAGGGSIVVPAMEKFLHMEEKKSHATAIAIVFLFSIVSTIVYLWKGYFDFHVWIPVTIGGVVGGSLGAKLLSKIPKGWLKIVFGIVILSTSVKMIF